MREYELCCEIFNQCSNNQMRDVDFQEVSVEDTDAYIRALEPRAEIQREDLQMYIDFNKHPGAAGED